MQVTIVEKIFNTDGRYRRTREKMYIEDFNSKYKGLNRNSWDANYKHLKKYLWFHFGTEERF